MKIPQIFNIFALSVGFKNQWVQNQAGYSLFLVTLIHRYSKMFNFQTDR